MSIHPFRWLLMGALCGAFAAGVAVASDPESSVLPEGEATRKLRVDNVGHCVAAEVVNMTDRELRDVELLVRHDFIWNDEFNPGEDDPSWADIVELEEPLPPRGRAQLRYVPPLPLPDREDGRFQTRVEVVRFNEMLPPVSAGPR